MIDIWTPEDPWPNDTRELLLIGPPGTGKTRNVLTSYVWPAMRAGEAVLATSYTCAAAEELRKRTSKELGISVGALRHELSTLHSEANRRCAALGFKRQRESDKGKNDEREEDVDEAEDHDVGLVARMEEEATRSGLAAWDRTRNLYPEDIGLSIEERLRRVGLYGSQLSDAIVAVERDIHKRTRDGVLVAPDFTTLLEQAILHGCERRLDLLCIDEAQDLCPLQWALIDKWAGEATRILIVGDPDQSIYVWAGADGRRLLSWIRAGRCARRLAQSYRVPAAPHRFSRRVIQLVVDREDAPYHPKDEEGTAREVYGDDAWHAIGKAQEDGETAFVLARTRAGVAQAAEDLERANIPHIAERGASLLGRPGSPSRALSVAQALDDIAHRRDVHPEGAQRLVAALSTKGLHMPMGAKGDLTALVRGRRSRVSLDDLEDAGLPTGELTGLWRLITDGAQAGLLHRDPEKEAARCFIASGVSAPDVVRAAKWIGLYGEALMTIASLVRVTTAHGSKGREAKVVVVDARSRVRGQQRPEAIDEDRRILYVAVTRTERDLIVLRNAVDEDWLSMHGLTVR